VTPLVRADDPAGQHCPARLVVLPHNLKSELVEAAERGQVRAGEGTVGHVEVFQMGQCENSPSSGDLGTYPGTAALTGTTPSSVMSQITRDVKAAELLGAIAKATPRYRGIALSAETALPVDSGAATF